MFLWFTKSHMKLQRIDDDDEYTYMVGSETFCPRSTRIPLLKCTTWYSWKFAPPLHFSIGICWKEDYLWYGNSSDWTEQKIYSQDENSLYCIFLMGGALIGKLSITVWRILSGKGVPLPLRTFFCLKTCDSLEYPPLHLWTVRQFDPGKFHQKGLKMKNWKQFKGLKVVFFGPKIPAFCSFWATPQLLTKSAKHFFVLTFYPGVYLNIFATILS